MRALISGITGQDGSYLSELLHSKGYEVHGLVRRVALEDQRDRIKRLEVPVNLIECDITNYGAVWNAFQKVKPNEVYHLAAQSFVAGSFKDPFETFQTNIMGTLNMLESFRQITPKSKFYFAASSEMFGMPHSSRPMNEQTPLYPRSPYGVSKVAGFCLARNYREAYNLHISSGILFNHESPKRGKEFVTRKITSQLKEIKLGQRCQINLGNIDAKRDWGYAGDYVEAMWLMLQQDKGDDYVIATGETHSIRDFLELADTEWKVHVKIDESQKRPSDVNYLCGDSSKAQRILGWRPTIKFKDLVKLMVDTE